MNDPNRWQPLHFLGGRIDQFGRPINESTQRHLTPFWGQVTPFAMTAADRSANGVYHDQGPPRQLGGPRTPHSNSAMRWSSFASHRSSTRTTA